MIRLDGDSASKVPTTSLSVEDLEESQLHAWFHDAPTLFLNEDLLLIGHEVQLETDDRIDFLAIDRMANLVVVELKRRRMHKNIYAQGLNYVSHIAEWGYDEIARQFEQTTDTALDVALDKFCDEEDWQLNENQRMILIGSEIRQRTEKIATWLHREGVDVTIILFDLFEDKNQLYLQPYQAIPEVSHLEIDRGTAASKAEWEQDAKAWHRKRTSEETWELLQELVAAFEEYSGFDRLSWTQKNYVAFYSGRKRLVKFNTDHHDISVGVTLDESLRGRLEVEDIVAATGVEENAITLDWETRWPLLLTCHREANTEKIRDYAIENIEE